MQTNFTLIQTKSTLRAAVLAGRIAALLALAIGSGNALAVDGVWAGNSSGNWSDASKWVDGVDVDLLGDIPDGAGATADLANVSLSSSNKIITMDTARTIGILMLGASGRNLDVNGPNILTLDGNGGNAQITFRSGGRNGSTGVAIELKSNLLITNPDSGGNNGILISGGLSSSNGNLTITNNSNLNSRTKFNSTVSDGTLGNSITYSQTVGWSEFNNPNTFTGTTTNVAGTIVLGHSLALQNSALDTTASVLGNNVATGNGLKIRGITTLTLGGLTGNKALASLFNTVDDTHNDLYAVLTALTLNPGTGANHTYTGNIVEGAAGMTVAKTGAGIQDLNGAQAYNTLTATGGTTNVNGLVGTVPASGTASVAVSGTGTKLRFGSVSQTLSSLTIGAGATVVFTSGVASGPFSGGGGKAPSFGGSVVPEPGTLGLLLVGALGVLNRRRRNFGQGQ